MTLFYILTAGDPGRAELKITRTPTGWQLDIPGVEFQRYPDILDGHLLLAKLLEQFIDDLRHQQRK